MDLLVRDVRGAYLGIDKRAGYFIGIPALETGRAFDTLELCTASSGIVRAALVPDENRDQWGQGFRPPVTDYIGVRYEYSEADQFAPGGLYRTTWAVPLADFLLDEKLEGTPLSSELISEAVLALRFAYFDGYDWMDYWETTEEDRRLPDAVSIEMALDDARGNEHVYQTIVSIPTQ
jgi:hypothetical protein